jgi:hypothetical protein
MSEWLTPNDGVRGAREGLAAPAVGPGGWPYGPQQGAMPVEVRDRDALAGRGDAPSVPLARRMSRALAAALSITGAAAGGILLGYFARETGHPTVDVAKIACLGAIAGAAVGAALGPAIRAIAWTVIATSIAAVGAGALWVVNRLDPLLLRNIFERHW